MAIGRTTESRVLPLGGRPAASHRSVVIGAGPNGLVAAIRLAEARRPVTVLEAAEHPGGAVRTEPLTLPGFHHDTFSSVYPAGAASPVFASMPLTRHGLRWIHPEACVAHPLPRGRAVALYRDVERTAASLDSVKSGDGARWRAFVEPMIDGFEAIRSTMLAGFPPLAGAWHVLTALGPAGATRFGLLVPASARALGTRLFAGTGSRAWLYGSAAHGDLPPAASGSAIAAVYLNLMGHVVGWPSPEGGAQRLTDALVAYLRELGGEIRTSAPVERVHASGGRVSGSRDRRRRTRGSGHRHRGRHATRAARAGRRRPPHGLCSTASPLPLRAGNAEGRLGARRADPLGSYRPRSAGTVHLSGDEDELLATLAETQNRLPSRPFMLLGQQSLADPTRAPDGKHTAWAYTRGPRTGVGWPQELDRHVARMEAQVERFAPGFRDLILARHVMGPAELERRNPNLVGGDVGGGSFRLRQLIFRPVPGLSPYRTPIAGLYLGSAATFPGGAVHGVPGDAAARAALAHS